MDFEFTEEQRIVRDAVYDFAKKEIEPIAAQIDRDDDFPMSLWKRMGELGILGVTIPPEYGGAGADLLTGALALEQLSRICPAVALSYGAHANLCANNLYKNGNEDQRKKYLPGLCDGSLIGSLAITEPNAGSDATSIITTAVKRGDSYILNGTKTFITNGPYCDVMICYAKTDRSLGAKGITAFIVEKGMKGFSCSKRLEKMGHRGSATGEMVLEDVEVPDANVLGQVNNGVHVMMTGLDIERAFLAAEPLGIAQGAFDLAVAYSKQREQFGQPISNFQLIQGILADMYTEMEASRLLTYKAANIAWKAARGGKGSEVHKVAAAAILSSAEMAMRVCDKAVQIFGGYGYTMEYPINRFLRDAKLMTIGAGTSEIRRLIIAREILA